MKSMHIKDWKDLPHHQIREMFTWGRNYNKEGEAIPYQKILLKDISDSHLSAIIVMLQQCEVLNPTIMPMLEERLFRQDNNIKVPDYED